ncbi:MAG: hypothetical protein ACKOXP_10655, partial [Flavobacteriales bacterium]
MKVKLFVSIFFIFSSITIFGDLFAQEIKPIMDTTKIIGKALKSTIVTSPCLGSTSEKSTDLKWLPILVKKKDMIEFHPESNHEKLIEEIKSDKLNTKKESKNPSEGATLKSTPTIGVNWLGNVNNGMTPMDNHLAISNNGIIVSVSNTTLE